MAYVDAYHDRSKDIIHVAERENGQWLLRQFKPPYTFYYADANGADRSIFGDPVKKMVYHTARKFRAEVEKRREDLVARGVHPSRAIFESDVNVLFRLLADEYANKPLPVLNVGFFDIEVDFDPERGYAPVEDPFAKVTAISVLHSATNEMFTFALRPQATFSREDADALEEETEGLIIFDDEAALLDAFLDIIENVCVLSGWNSEQYDIPYLVNRIRRVLGEDAIKRFCLWDVEPKARDYEKFGRKFQTYELVGRPHLDYLLLYQKHNAQQQASYRLDYIGEIETGENKVPYEGTLDRLYRFEFPKFIAYNRQDVFLLGKIDAKRKYIDLANQIAHANGVLLKTTMGSVSLIETAIINEMHKMGFVVPDRKDRRDDDETVDVDIPDDDFGEDEETRSFEEAASTSRFSLRGMKDNGRIPVVGAYVAKPVVGLHDHVGGCDINSLYPSVIRGLNMSPETILGQVRPDSTKALIKQRIADGIPRAEAWEGLFSTVEVAKMHDRDAEFVVTVDWEDGTNEQMTAAELYDLIFSDNPLCITANGTIFRTDQEGMIPKLLAAWYAERKMLQKKAKEYGAKAKEAKAAGNEEEAKEAAFQAEYYDRAQFAAKIRLNSLYGALLNEACRFYDERIGQSTTLTGRAIVRHMSAKVNEVVTGEYNHTGKAVVYGDTDSVYFTATGMQGDPNYEGFDWSPESIIELYDGIAEDVNASFPEFMDSMFHTGLARGGIIKAGRELVASKALFIKKKKYACLIYDLEGQRQDVDGKPGKSKVMGLDLKRADTPKYMQQFLSKLLLGVLTGVPKSTMYEWIAEFRGVFKDRPGWEKGTPRKVNGLTEYGNAVKRADVTVEQRGKSGKVQMPGHVKASMNWNKLADMYGDKAVTRITDGAKIIVCKLKPNVMRMDSVAYPIDEANLPEWFKELPFDHEAMEQGIINQKIMNLVGVLDWDLSETRAADNELDALFG